MNDGTGNARGSRRGPLSALGRGLLENRKILKRLPVVGPLAGRYLLSRTALSLEDSRPPVRYANSYLLVSELRSEPFQRVMRHMESYVGAGGFGPQKYWEYPWLLGNLQLEPGMRVLDAGCGTAPMQYAMARLGCDVAGVDPNEGVEWHGIDRGLARRFGCRIEYRVASIEKIDFPDNTFDRVSCASVIEHCRVVPLADGRMVPLTDDDRALHRRMMAELVRVLKPGGLLVLTTDYYVPRDNCLAESNVDIANLFAVDGADREGDRCPEPFPGEEGFSVEALIRNGDIALDTYAGILQTSVGITLRKRS